MNITKDQFWGALQHLFTVLVAIAAGLNYISGTVATEIMVVVIGVQAWWNHTPGQAFNLDQFVGAVQHLLTLFAALFATKGWLSPEHAAALPGLLITVGSLALQHDWNSPAKTPTLPPACLALFFLSALALNQSGCAQLEAVAQNPTVQAVAKDLAHAAINYGLEQLGARVKETRPFLPLIEAHISFAAAATPTQAADAISQAIAASDAPSEIKQQVRDAIVQALANPPASLYPSIRAG